MNNIILGVTGSVAAIKSDKMFSELSSIGDVKIVGTNAGKFFLKESIGLKEMLDSYELLKAGNNNLFFDEDEWRFKKIGDPILHIELRKWASCLVIAPLDANTLAKIVNGICDNLLTSVVRAWDWEKPMILCPAMNTYMWQNDPTSEHLKIMKGRGAFILDPVEKTLACGDVGMGAMAPIDLVVKTVNEKLKWHFPLKFCNGIPINHHPGAFGFNRKKNHHTGVDLYTNDGEPVYAVEDGVVVKIDKFTGPDMGHDWWESTWGVMVEGASGVVNYGEVTPNENLKINSIVKRGSHIANVKRVLFEHKLRKDIPGHSCSMLHLELYKTGTREFADWHDPQKNPNLLDPTSFLILSENCDKHTLTWENAESLAVG